MSRLLIILLVGLLTLSACRQRPQPHALSWGDESELADLQRRIRELEASMMGAEDKHCQSVFDDFRKKVEFGMTSKEVARAVGTDWLAQTEIKWLSSYDNSIPLKMDSTMLSFCVFFIKPTVRLNTDDDRIYFRLSISSATADLMHLQPVEIGELFLQGKLQQSKVVLQEFALYHAPAELSVVRQNPEAMPYRRRQVIPPTIERFPKVSEGDATVASSLSERLSARFGNLPEKDILEITELLITRMLIDHNKEYECFLSLGRKAGASLGGPWFAPPPELLARFPEWGFPVRSCDEMAYKDHGIQDAKTGKKGYVYYLRLINQISPDEFLFEAVGVPDDFYSDRWKFLVTRTAKGWQFKVTEKASYL
ncbi:MAG: hypothetical protein JXA52_00475 [Planctomycetes bacterium]|nr:hypothetical protein [Planctomycetota bacterium]